MSWQEIKLKLSDELKQRLSDRHVSEDEVKQVIHHAEETGDKAYQPDANRYLAKLQIGSATFYADYSVEEGAYLVRSAYAHKAELKV